MLCTRIRGTDGCACRASPGCLWPLVAVGINQHGELAVVEQAQRAEQPTAGRDRFPYRPRHSTAAGTRYHRPVTIGTKQQFRKLRNYGICGIYGIEESVYTR